MIKVTFYPDSSFFAHSNIAYEEGTLFEIIGETNFEYEDEAQNQKFKWYQVKTPDNRQGWIYGDGIAVIMPETAISSIFKPYHLKTFKFSEDLVETTFWIASIEGKDNFHEEDFLNPLYKESYLVLTSNLGKSFHIHLSGESTMGSSELLQFHLQDLTEDSIPELLFLKNNIDNSSRLEDRVLEIFAFQAGSIAEVFEERLSLTYEAKTPSPALYKFVDINPKNIRIAFVDYLACKDYGLMLQSNDLDAEKEKCLEYVTYSFVWQEAQNRYVPFYEESRTYVEGILKPSKGFLRSEPSYLSEIVEKLPAQANLKIIQHYEKRINQRGEEKIVPYFYAQSSNGAYGYIHAKDVDLQVPEYASILNSYYKNPPLDKHDWSKEVNFINLKSTEQLIIITKKE